MIVIVFVFVKKVVILVKINKVVVNVIGIMGKAILDKKSSEKEELF